MINYITRDWTIDTEEFKEMIAYVERLSSLANWEDQLNHALLAWLWIAVKEQECTLHAQSKNGIQDNFTTAVEELMD